MKPRRKKTVYPYCLIEGKRLWFCPQCKHNHRVYAYWPQLVGWCPTEDTVYQLMLIPEQG